MWDMDRDFKDSHGLAVLKVGVLEALSALAACAVHDSDGYRCHASLMGIDPSAEELHNALAMEVSRVIDAPRNLVAHRRRLARIRAEGRA
jgi:hypothetical protein